MSTASDSKNLWILSVSSNREVSRRLKRLFPGSNVTVKHEPSLDNVLDRFKDERFDVLLITSTAFNQCEVDGERVLEIITAKSPMTQVIFLADSDDMETAMLALRAGAYQYSRFPIGDEELRLLVETAVKERPLYGANLMMEGGKKRRKLGKLTGESPPIQKIYKLIKQAAASDIPVLIYGDTGTGKELAAQAIHNESGRGNGPFIPVHLGALPEELVASELFGHEKGSFTGAVEQRKGTFELGHKGTVFLDEIGTVNEKVQISLLRLIDQNKFHRLGGRRSVKTEVRLIAATNQNLREEVEKGNFREDLYFRLDVFRIDMPPLKERKSDIPFLVEEFINHYNGMFQKSIIEISPDVIASLDNYHWPGNIRELKNVIQRAVLVCAGKSLLLEHLPERFWKNIARPKAVFEIGTPLDEIERQMIIKTLAAVNNNRTRAAKLLGISRRALYNRLRKHSLM